MNAKNSAQVYFLLLLLTIYNSLGRDFLRPPRLPLPLPFTKVVPYVATDSPYQPVLTTYFLFLLVVERFIFRREDELFNPPILFYEHLPSEHLPIYHLLPSSHYYQL